MNKVVVVHFLGVDDVTVLFLTQVHRVDPIGSEELSVGHAERLADGLCNKLCLQEGEGVGENYSAEWLSQSTTARRRERSHWFERSQNKHLHLN